MPHDPSVPARIEELGLTQGPGRPSACILRRDSDKIKDKQVEKKSWVVESAGKKIRCEEVPENDEG